MPAALSTCGCETVTILDWDDTLLASSFLAAKGFNRLDVALHRGAEIDAQLKQLEHAVIAILTRAAEFGRVHIITNAETGWVQLSAQTFLPGVLPYLDKVRISSARSQYEPVFPAAPVQWKYCEFHDKILSSGVSGVTGISGVDDVERNVVSLGDSRVEREAVLTVCRGLPRTRCKSIKFAERPTLEQLRLQLELVTQCYSDICRHDGDLDLQLALFADTPSPPPSPPANTNNNNTEMDTTESVPATRPRPPSQTQSQSPVTHARVQLVGYQPPVMTAMAPFAVACGAYSQLVVQANGQAVVVPVQQQPQQQQANSTAAAAVPATNTPPAAPKQTSASTLNAGVEVTEVSAKALVSDELMCARTAQQAAVSVMS